MKYAGPFIDSTCLIRAGGLWISSESPTDLQVWLIIGSKLLMVCECERERLFASTCWLSDELMIHCQMESAQHHASPQKDNDKMSV